VKRIVIRGIIIFYLFVSVFYAGAQSVKSNEDKNNMAILTLGPVESTGFPLIYPNALKVWAAYYRYLGSEVKVSFTRENIIIPTEWESLTCDKIRGLQIDKESFFYNNTDWVLIFQFSQELALDCRFVNRFIVRLKYFLRDANLLEPPLFPAILEIR